MSGYPQGPPMPPGSTEHAGIAGATQQMPAGQLPTAWMNMPVGPGGQMPGGQMPGGQMPGGQMPVAQMQGFMDPAMMQAAMAAFQQGQGAGAPGGMPQMYFPGMQQQPGVAAMQGAPAPVGAAMPTPVSAPLPPQMPAMQVHMPMPMAAPAAAPAPGQEEQEKWQAINTCVQSLSDAEREYYTFLWEHHSPQPLKGQAAFTFLMKSKLTGETLKRIWSLADWQKRGVLAWEDFVVAMKLISAAQKKQLVSLERVLENCSPNSMDCPEFDGIESAAILRGRAIAAAGGDSLLDGGAEFVAAALPEASATKEQMSAVPPAAASDGLPAPAAMPALDVVDAGSSPPAAPPAPPAAATAAAVSGGNAITDIMLGMAGSFAEPKAVVEAEPDPMMQSPATGAAAAAPAHAAAGAVAAAPAGAWDAFGAQDLVEAPGSAPATVGTSDHVDGAASDTADTKPQPQMAEASWSAFGDAATMPAPLAPAATASESEDWGAFGGAQASAPAPAQEWSAFGEPANTSAAAAPAVAPPAGPGAESWDAFGAPAAQAASSGQGTGPGQGDIWAKISNAFDDLLREDDVIPTGTAEGSGEGPAETPAPEQPAPSLLDEKGTDDWGDFETSAPAPPAVAAVPLAASFATDFEAPSSSPAAPPPSTGFDADFPEEKSSDNWGDFETSVSAPPMATTVQSVPLAADFATDFSPPADSAADVSQAEKSADDWGDFETSAPAPSAAVPPVANDFTADFGAAPSAAVPPVANDFAADFGAAPSAADAPVASDFSADFAAVASAGTGASGAPAFPSEVEWPSAEPQAAAAESSGAGDWAAFDFDPPERPQAAAQMPEMAEGEQTNLAVAAPSAGDADFFFDDDKAHSGPSPGVVRSPNDAIASNADSQAPPASAEASWGAFDEDDNGMDFVSATPAADAAAAAPEPVAAASDPGAGASDWSAEFTSAAPAFPDSSPPAAAEGAFPAEAPAVQSGNQPFAFEDAAPEVPSSASAEPAPAPAFAEMPKGAPDSEDEEHRSLARSLADLGLYEDAQQCQVRSDVVRRLSDAESRKKAAIAREDFEGCIAVRNEIKDLTSELTAAGDLEAWRRLVASAERDAGLDTVAERLRQRCQFVESAASRAALCMAIGNFRKVCPPRNTDSLADLSGLIRRRRRAWQMSRAIDHVSSSDILLVLQVLLVCLGTMRELLSTCARSLQELASAELSQEERQLAIAAEELRDHVRGLCSLRRLNWRFGLSAELFLPNGAGIESLDVGELSAEDSQTLEEIHKSINSGLHEAKAAWACVETELSGLQLDLGSWDPNECYEVLGGSSASTAAERHSTAPLCVLCLLPAVPIGREAPVDTAVASALWKKGVWHVQCANFWIRHASTSKLLTERGISDPFRE